MNEGRLKHVTSQSNWTRKLTIISNGMAKRELDTYRGSLSRAARRVAVAERQASLPLKLSLLHMRGYHVCLRRRLAEDADTMLLPHAKEQVVEVIEEFHPRARRRRRNRQLLADGLAGGQLLRQEDIHHRIQHIFDADATSSDTRFDRRPPPGLFLPPIEVGRRGDGGQAAATAARGRVRTPHSVINAWN